MPKPGTCHVNSCWKHVIIKISTMALGIFRKHLKAYSSFSPFSLRLWKPALELLQEIRSVGLRPSTQTYNRAISACVKAGQFNQAMSLLQEMEDYGVSADLVTYNTVGTRIRGLVILGHSLSRSPCDLYIV